jgi:hypothetical protein
VTADQLSATEPAPGVAAVIEGAASVPTLAAALPPPVATKYATAPLAAASTAAVAIRRIRSRLTSARSRRRRI